MSLTLYLFYSECLTNRLFEPCIRPKYIQPTPGHKRTGSNCNELETELRIDIGAMAMKANSTVPKSLALL